MIPLTRGRTQVLHGLRRGRMTFVYFACGPVLLYAFDRAFRVFSTDDKVRGSSGPGPIPTAAHSALIACTRCACSLWWV